MGCTRSTRARTGMSLELCHQIVTRRYRLRLRAMYAILSRRFDYLVYENSD